MGAPFADQPDQYVIDARRFGIPTGTYVGCVSGCGTCRGLRNKVRAAREEEQKQADAQRWADLFFSQRYRELPLFVGPASTVEYIGPDPIDSLDEAIQYIRDYAADNRLAVRIDFQSA